MVQFQLERMVPFILCFFPHDNISQVDDEVLILGMMEWAHLIPSLPLRATIHPGWVAGSRHLRSVKSSQSRWTEEEYRDSKSHQTRPKPLESTYRATHQAVREESHLCGPEGGQTPLDLSLSALYTWPKCRPRGRNTWAQTRSTEFLGALLRPRLTEHNNF